MNGDLPVSRDTFITEDDPKRFRMHLFDTLEFMVKQQDGSVTQCDKRFKKLEGQKAINTAVAAGGGVFGGIVAVMGKWFFFKGG